MVYYFPAMSNLSTITDNPCWGGPQPHQHNLNHLLNILSENNSVPITTTSQAQYSSFLERIHQKLILFQDEHYLVINKPPDLRMDGDYAATVHKLLLFLFPPPSLQISRSMDYDGSFLKDNDDAIQATSILKEHTKLLQIIAPLSKHPSLQDDPFRIVHQLDYATSGVLLYAKNKSAASTACKSFQERKTHKEYVAVVVNPNANVSDPPLSLDFIQALPILPSSCLSPWKDGSLENRYRKKRKRDTSDRESKKNTFDGFMPVHSVFAKWRASLLASKKKEEESSNGQQSKPRKKRPYDNLPPLPEPDTPLTSEEMDEILSFGPSWKIFKSSKEKHSRCWITVVERIAKEYNQSLSQFYANQKEKIEQSKAVDMDVEKTSSSIALPPLFRIHDKEADSQSPIHESFYICASIGEPKGDRFDVVVDPSIVKSPIPDKSSDTNNTTALDMKPSLTKCTVLWRGSMKVQDNTNLSIPVTKVLLQPWTGRRHQLRVHLAHVTGFPILGDVTYGGNIKIKGDGTETCDNNDSLEDSRVACRRMCLHAKRLAIPLINGKERIFEAPDPFRIIEEPGGTHGFLEVIL